MSKKYHFIRSKHILFLFGIKLPRSSTWGLHQHNICGPYVRFVTRGVTWWNLAPLHFASCTRPSMKFADVSLITGVMSQSSSGLPTVSFCILELTLHTSWSAIHSMAKITFTAVHRWPLSIHPKFRHLMQIRWLLNIVKTLPVVKQKEEYVYWTCIISHWLLH